MIHVIKANGEKEVFSDEKVRYSIHRAGIPDEIQNDVLSHVKQKLHEGISTAEIYHHITEFLTSSQQPFVQAKYSLKQAIMLLGPTGYPFEDFVAALLQAEGYTTQTRQILQGKCISHEIDVLAEKEGKRIAVEAKFHNGSGIRTEVHVALYTKARFDDIKDRNNIAESWIVTNTKATLDAVNYGDCAGMHIVSWSLPEGRALRDLVEKHQLHPITTLTSLSQQEKQQLLENHIVLCKQIADDPSVLSNIAIPEEKKKVAVAEASYVSKA